MAVPARPGPLDLGERDRTSIGGAWILRKVKRGIPHPSETQGGFSSGA